MTIGRKVETANDAIIEQSARVASGAAGRPTTPEAPLKIRLRHSETGHVDEYWPVDAREILAQENTPYVPHDDLARDVLAGVLANGYTRPEPVARSK